jgi:hypothetical protein
MFWVVRVGTGGGTLCVLSAEFIVSGTENPRTCFARAFSLQVLKTFKSCSGLELWQNFLAKEIQLFRIGIGQADDQGVESPR